MYIHHGWSLCNSYWSIEKIVYLRSISLPSARRLTLTTPIVLNQSNDFRCKSRKIASVRLAVCASCVSRAVGRTFVRHDVHFDEKDGETISKFQKLNLSYLSY